MANKRISQLVELTAAEVQLDDVFVIVDSSAKESKKIQASQLSLFLAGSGSLDAVHAILADTASYILASNVAGNVDTASYAIRAGSSSFADSSNTSTTASFAITASFAKNAGSQNPSASFLIYAGFHNGTASFALTASRATNATNATNLIYTGVPNGTASYAITTANVAFATNAATASFLAGSGPTSVSSSYALFAENANNANFATDAGFLEFSPNNGTASYAISAGSVSGKMNDFGIFFANTQSAQVAQLDSVDIFPSLDTPQQTYIESWGTLIVPFTSSMPTSGNLMLNVKDRDTGIVTTLDTTPILLNLSPTVGNWDSYDSGTIKMTYDLIGQSTLQGSYLVFVTSSFSMSIDPSRTVRFNVCSRSDIVESHVSESIVFAVTPSSGSTLRFTSLDGGPFLDSLTGFNTTASNRILTLNVQSQSLTSVRYLWTLNNLTQFVCSRNFGLGGLPTFPHTLTYLSCSICAITEIPSLAATTTSFLDCSGNSLVSLPTLYTTMSYLNCDSNFITALPDPLPFGLITLTAGNNQFTNLPATFPNSIGTMSLNNNPISSFSPSLPLSLSYFNVSDCTINSLPSIPSGTINLSASNCELTLTAMSNIASQLVINGKFSGSLNILSNGIPDAGTLTNIVTLQSRAWSVLYDT